MFKYINKLFVLTLLLFFSTIQALYSQCDLVKIEQADKKYKTGHFSEVINMLDTCMKSGFTDKLKVQGYRILAKTYIALDNDSLANENVNNLLKLDPSFQPDNLTDPPKFNAMVELLKQNGNIIQVTSVSKKAENILEAPATVLVITDEDIRNRGYIDLEQLFSDLPGFDISRVYGVTFSNIYQRGYRSNNTDRTLFLIDGIEENDLWSNWAYWSRQYPISNVKRVEVVYGPSSTMYGANAFLGVVNIITKNQYDYKKALNINANTGMATYNTKYSDITIAGKQKNMFISVTGRYFYSDERNLSEYPEYDFDQSYYETVNYKKLLSVYKPTAAYKSSPYYTVVGDSALLNDVGIAKAKELDLKALNDTLNGNKVGYSNISEHYFINTKFSISNFTVGFVTWKYKQGNINYLTDRYRCGADNGAVWVPDQTYTYAKYDFAFSDKLSISNTASYKISEITPNTVTIVLQTYDNGALKAKDIIKNTPSSWATTYWYQQSKQFRNELKISYNPLPYLDIISGLEIRNSTIQGDYKSTKTDTASAIDIGVSVMDTIPGGNQFDIRDIGVYSQGTYKYKGLISLTVGARYDYNRIRVNGGYGSIVNPRFALVLTPYKFVFKAIYASAFQNASIQSKYAIGTTRKLNNPTLPPEKVTNFEFYGGYKITENMYFDVVYYNSKYSNIIGAVNVPYKGGTTQQNQAIGALKIQGVQLTFSYRLNTKFGTLNFYSNANYTDPQNNIIKDGILTNKYQRIGDIADYRVNFGVNAFLFKHLNINLRINHISERITGEGTSVPANKEIFPAITIFNTTVGWYNLVKGLDIQLVCNNFTDLEYFDPGIRSADGISNAFRTPQYTRYFVLRLMYNF